MSNCLIIPTYWSTPELLSWKIFDHPIPISEEGTLGRTLDNLETLSFPDPVILFPSPCDPLIELKVAQIVAGRSLDIRIFTQADLDAMRTVLSAKGFPSDLLPTVDLNSYGGVRNVGLLYAAINGFDNAIMIDDDECIDEDYLASATRYMGEQVNGIEILGKTGCVFDSEGRKFYDGQSSFVMENWPKDILFNENVRLGLESKDALSECTVAFGGNMVINRKMFLRVPFDPFGTRGEDDDYVLNARFCNLPFFFDKDLLLLHLPPPRHGSFWSRQRQDILRFKYVREKVRLFGFLPKTLGTFMEYFTQDDLEYKAVSSSIQAAIQFVDRDRVEFHEFMQNAILAESTPVHQLRSRVENFIRFMEAWQEVLPKL